MFKEFIKLNAQQRSQRLSRDDFRARRKNICRLDVHIHAHWSPFYHPPFEMGRVGVPGLSKKASKHCCDYFRRFSILRPWLKYRRKFELVNEGLPDSS